MIQRPCRRAFTIVELMIVVVIIALLSAIGLYVGRMVAESGRARATQNTIQILDQVLSEYQAAKGTRFPEVFTDGMGIEFPMIDGRLAGDPDLTVGARVNPSLSLFLAHARQEVPAVDQALNKIDSKYIERQDHIETLWTNPNQPRLANNVGFVPAIIVKDGWGRPIRFVHPSMSGGWGPGYRKDTTSTNADAFTASSRPAFAFSRDPAVIVRRSAWPFNPTARPDGAIGDADEGKCVGGNPYFYSVGPDGDPGTREDNIYSNKKPAFDADTRQGNQN